jgi:mRNA interferase RelE/StbE
MVDVYRVRYSAPSLKALKKMDRQVADSLVGWMSRHIDGCSDPRVFGGRLSANLSDRWRYRVGNYRILVRILDREVVVEVMEIGHRKENYHQR